MAYDAEPQDMLGWGFASVLSETDKVRQAAQEKDRVKVRRKAVRRNTLLVNATAETVDGVVAKLSREIRNEEDFQKTRWLIKLFQRIVELDGVRKAWDQVWPHAIRLSDEEKRSFAATIISRYKFSNTAVDFWDEVFQSLIELNLSWGWRMYFVFAAELKEEEKAIACLAKGMREETLCVSSDFEKLDSFIEALCRVVSQAQTLGARKRALEYAWAKFSLAPDSVKHAGHRSVRARFQKLAPVFGEFGMMDLFLKYP